MAIWQEESRRWEWEEMRPCGGTWRGCLAASAPATTERLRVAARAFYHQQSSSTVEHGPCGQRETGLAGKLGKKRASRHPSLPEIGLPSLMILKAKLISLHIKQHVQNVWPSLYKCYNESHPETVPFFLSDPSPIIPLTYQYAPQNEAGWFATSLTVGQIDESRKIRVKIQF